MSWNDFSWSDTYLLVLGVHSIVEKLTCYGLGTYNPMCAGEIVECKCKTTSPLHRWDIHPLINICDDDVFQFHAASSETSSCGGFTVTYNNSISNSTVVFKLNESESLCVECENGNNFPDIVNRSRSTCIRDPGMINNNYLYNNVYHM